MRDAPGPGLELQVGAALNAADAFPGEEAGHAVDLTLAADGTFRFASPVQTLAPRNNLVIGRLYPVSPDWRKSPTAILLHGWNADLCYRYLFPYLASQLKGKGMNTAILGLPYHMHRRPQTGAVTDFISSDLRRMLEATRQALADIRALYRWMEAQSGPGVGLWGFSLGAWLTGLMLEMEPGLRWGVLTTPIARMDRAMKELPFCEPVRKALARETLDFGELNLGTRPPRIALNRILLMESAHDLFAPAETVEELWRQWGNPEIWRLPQGHISVLLSVKTLQRTAAWIRDRVD